MAFCQGITIQGVVNQTLTLNCTSSQNDKTLDILHGHSEDSYFSGEQDNDWALSIKEKLQTLFNDKNSWIEYADCEGDYCRISVNFNPLYMEAEMKKIDEFTDFLTGSTSWDIALNERMSSVLIYTAKKGLKPPYF